DVDEGVGRAEVDRHVADPEGGGDVAAGDIAARAVAAKTHRVSLSEPRPARRARPDPVRLMTAAARPRSSSWRRVLPRLLHVPSPGDRHRSSAGFAGRGPRWLLRGSGGRARGGGALL